MIFKDRVSGDVPGIHATDGVIHQELGIELGNVCGRCDRSKGLTKIITPLRERISILLRFRDASEHFQK